MHKHLLLKKTSNILTKLLLVLIFFIGSWNLSFSQCTSNTSLFPATPITVNPNGDITEISDCNYLEEYSIITGIVSGENYDFTVTSSGYITVVQGGTVLNHGVTPVSVTANASTDITVYWNVDASCAQADVCEITTVQCITCTPAPPAPGETCDVPLDITSLPFNTTDNTNNYFDDYSGSPGSSCGSTSPYLNGNDVVYSYTATQDINLDIIMSNITASYSGIFIYGSCDDIGVTCLDGVANSGSADRVITDFFVADGNTIYIVISTWATPQSVGYDLDISEASNLPLCAENQVPTDGAMDVAIECGGNTVLNWSPSSAGPSPDMYQVYFGTSATPPLVATISETSYMLSNLTTNSTYYYQIIPESGGNDAMNCPINSFTTAASTSDSGSGGLTQVYYFANNNNQDGTAGGDFVWDDPVALGHTEITSWTSGNDDDGYMMVALPFTYKYYGIDYNDIFIGSNGYASFGSGYASTGGATDLGSTSDPDNMIAIAMMDLDDRTDGQIFYGPIDDNTFAITWYHYHDYFDESEFITMQLILQNLGGADNDVFELRYNQDESSASIPDFLSDAVIGCEDVNANATTEFARYREDGVGGPMFCSPLVIGFGPTESSVSLPLDLVSFDGQAHNNQNILSWTTANEVNTQHFEIQSSSDGINWRPIGQVQAAGFSSSIEKYSYTDMNPSSINYYRLKMIDLDGSYEFSPIITLDRLSDGDQITAVHPNPANQELFVEYISTINSNIEISIYDIHGRLVEQLRNLDVSKGQNQFGIDLTDLSSGIYMLKVNAQSHSLSIKFVKN